MKRIFSVAVIIGAAAILLLASACTGSPFPTISSLTSDATWTAPGDSLRVSCVASVSGGGELSYSWSASRGTVTGSGPVVDWTAPQQVGMYDITVVVTSAQGRTETQSLSLIVSNGPPPSIQGLVVTARDHTYLRTTAAGYQAARTYEYDIECMASATQGEITYEWSHDGGEIDGDGSAVIWTAPDRDGRVTVTVKVFDGEGNWASKSLVFQVVDCEACVVW
ncbi:MAG: hypothetical protein IBX67_00630 [Dehalococcoidia bacterium]|nr:hypothetical protein [Dehalococcoidia bacterium]